MTKQGKALPARRPPERFEQSALLRSAETLGRMIGELQRRLDGATKRLARSTPDEVSSAALRHHPNGHGAIDVKSRKTAAATTRAMKPKAEARPTKAKARKASAKKQSRRS